MAIRQLNKNVCKSIVLCFAAMMLIFTVAIIGVFCIPASAIRENVVKSANEIQEDGLWYQPLGFYLYQVDNMTDCLMLNIAATADSDNPAQSSMLAKVGRYEYDELRGNYLDMPQMTHDVALYGTEHMDSMQEYARYWHGYQIFLRPLLALTSYHTIIAVNIVLLLMLVALTLLLAYKRFTKAEFWSFAVSLALVFVPCAPLCLQFSTCFYIALIGMCVLLWDNRVSASSERLCAFFFLLGGLTSYFDFLTTPQLTLGFPLITLMLIRAELRTSKTVAGLSVLWAAGYSLIWAGKWLMASLITHKSIMDSVVGAAGMRVSDSIVYGGEEMLMSEFFYLIWQKLCSVVGTVPVYGCVVLLLMLIAFACIMAYRYRAVLRPYSWLILIVLIVPVWYIVMKNHTLQHIFFTWRAIAVMIWSLSLLIIYIKNRVLSGNYSAIRL